MPFNLAAPLCKVRSVKPRLLRYKLSAAYSHRPGAVSQLTRLRPPVRFKSTSSSGLGSPSLRHSYMPSVLSKQGECRALQASASSKQEPHRVLPARAPPKGGEGFVLPATGIFWYKPRILHDHALLCQEQQGAKEVATPTHLRESRAAHDPGHARLSY